MHFSTSAALVVLAVVAFGDDDEETCTIQHCGNFTDNNVLKYYGGLFKTDDEILMDQMQWRFEHDMKYGNNVLSAWAQLFDHEVSTGTNGDYDQCCPTTISHVNPSTMTNIKGELRSIIHLNQLTPPQYQWIPQNGCSSAPNYCHGICRVENITLYLLVADFNNSPPFRFDSFYVPGYCSCKSA